MNKIRQYQGYLCVDLCNKKTKRHSIHRLVAFAFCSNPNKYNHVNHIDGNKSNNNSENLEWVTCSQNHKHAFKIGLRVPTKGELSGTSKLTLKEVTKIRLDFQTGNYTHKEIGIKYNISRRHIGDIINKVCWK